MLHTCVQTFDVTGNLEIFFWTKHGLGLLVLSSTGVHVELCKRMVPACSWAQGQAWVAWLTIFRQLPNFPYLIFSRQICFSHSHCDFFANYTSTDADAQHTSNSHLYEHTYTNLTYISIASAHLEIDGVTIGVSLSTETSPTTESTTPLNPEINLEKYEHPCQVEGLSPGR
jgi:hypothetical protein